MNRSVVGLTFVSWIFAAIPALAGEAILSDFEGTSLAAWSFSNGPEFPGARGSLTALSSDAGNNARLTYDLSNGGNYVSATLSLEPSVDAAAFRLRLRTPLGTKARLRLEDASRQTLQYDIIRPLEGSFDAMAWYGVTVDVSAPSSHYGGANDGIPHPPFASLGLLAVPDGNSVGALDFDDVTAVVGEFEASVDPAASEFIAAPAGAAELAPRLGVSLHTTNGTPGLDIVRDAGFSTVRIDLLWQHSELTKGVYNFTEFDAFVDALARRGLRLHLILDYENPLYPAVDEPGFASVTIPAFGALARATARHFAGKGVTYEIWNEPNTKTFWPGDAALYAELCRAAIDAVHAGDPTAKVTTGGISGFDLPFLRAVIEKGGIARTDAVGVHPYRSGGPETVGSDLLRLRGLLATSMPSPPDVWDTEWGYSSTWSGNGHGTAERQRHARLVTRELLSAWAMGFPLIVYYDLRDDGTDPTNAEHNFGLLQNDYSDKPAMVAVRQLTRAARNHRYVGMLQSSISTLHAMRLDGDSSVTLVIWAEDTKRPTKVHLRGDASIVDFLGNPRPATRTSSGQDLIVQESDGPLYVTFPGAGVLGNVIASGGDGGGVGAGTSTTSVTSNAEEQAGVAGLARGDVPGCGCRIAPQRRDPAATSWPLLVLLAFAARVASRRRRGGLVSCESG